MWRRNCENYWYEVVTIETKYDTNKILLNIVTFNRHFETVKETQPNYTHNIPRQAVLAVQVSDVEVSELLELELAGAVCNGMRSTNTVNVIHNLKNQQCRTHNIPN